jgi:hypothetical protein
VKQAWLGPPSVLPRVIGGPAVAVRKLVTPDLGLDGRRHRALDPRDHEEAGMGVDLRAAKRVVRRHDPVHRMAIVLDLREAPLPYGQRAPVGMIVDGGRGTDRMDRRLSGIHGHAARLIDFGPNNICIGACAPHRQVCIVFFSSRRRRNLHCIMRQSDQQPHRQGKDMEAVDSIALCICTRACSQALLSSARSASCALVRAETAASNGDHPSLSVFSAASIESGVGW